MGEEHGAVNKLTACAQKGIDETQGYQAYLRDVGIREREREKKKREKIGRGEGDVEKREEGGGRER